MATEIMNLNNNSPLAVLPTADIEQFRADSMTATASRLVRRSRMTGKTDSVLHLGNQLTTNDVVGHVLTITRVGFASVPATDNDGNPVFETDDNGAVILSDDGTEVQAMSVFPVCWFAEAPNWWYNGGQLLLENIREWADEVGDDITDFMLPKVNAELTECGGIRAYFAWKESKKNNRKYVSMILA